ncbi:MAG: hypothetical protein PVG99_13355 [Desulfobacteraceae bacterium]|jgi:hypothetical protein
MRLESLRPAMVICLAFLVFALQAGASDAGTIEGVVKGDDGEVISGVALLLYDVIEGEKAPEFTISGNKGDFQFPVDDQPRLYRLIAYTEAKSWDRYVTYGGKEVPIEMEVGEKWYRTKSADRVWTLISMLFSFFLGLVSREVLDRINKGRAQKSIASMYEKSVIAFTNEYAKTKDITEYKESTYSAFLAKFIELRENVKALVSYSWAVEKIRPEFFSDLQDKLSKIQEMETTVPFDEALDHEEKLIFLKDHHDERSWPPDVDEHERFKRLLEELRKIRG